MAAADLRGPRAKGRGGRLYRPGIGPHPERHAVELTLREMKSANADVYGSMATQFNYPGSRQKCDIFWPVGQTSWALEVKMIRFRGDNGKLADTSVQDILSPYAMDHSAVSDCVKLTQAGFPGRTAVLIYGFDDDERPLSSIVEAFEVLASHMVQLGARHEARMASLVHPVFCSGMVFGWEVSGRAEGRR